MATATATVAADSSSQSSQWPLQLDLTRDECRGILRRCELDTYATVIGTFRAQGALDATKTRMLRELRTILHITDDRHKAEARRVANDERLCTVAELLAGPGTGVDWSREGHRSYPLLQRSIPHTALLGVANAAQQFLADTNRMAAAAEASASAPPLPVDERRSVVRADPLRPPVDSSSSTGRPQKPLLKRTVSASSGGAGGPLTAPLEPAYNSTQAQQKRLAELLAPLQLHTRIPRLYHEHRDTPQPPQPMAAVPVAAAAAPFGASAQQLAAAKLAVSQQQQPLQQMQPLQQPQQPQSGRKNTANHHQQQRRGAAAAAAAAKATTPGKAARQPRSATSAAARAAKLAKQAPAPADLLATLKSRRLQYPQLVAEQPRGSADTFAADAAGSPAPLSFAWQEQQLQHPLRLLQQSQPQQPHLVALSGTAQQMLQNFAPMTLDTTGLRGLPALPAQQPSPSVNVVYTTSALSLQDGGGCSSSTDSARSQPPSSALITESTPISWVTDDDGELQFAEPSAEERRNEEKVVEIVGAVSAGVGQLPALVFAAAPAAAAAAVPTVQTVHVQAFQPAQPPLEKGSQILLQSQQLTHSRPTPIVAATAAILQPQPAAAAAVIPAQSQQSSSIAHKMPPLKAPTTLQPSAVRKSLPSGTGHLQQHLANHPSPSVGGRAPKSGRRKPQPQPQPQQPPPQSLDILYAAKPTLVVSSSGTNSPAPAPAAPSKPAASTIAPATSATTIYTGSGASAHLQQLLDPAALLQIHSISQKVVPPPKSVTITPSAQLQPLQIVHKISPAQHPVALSANSNHAAAKPKQIHITHQEILVPPKSMAAAAISSSSSIASIASIASISSVAPQPAAPLMQSKGNVKLVKSANGSIVLKGGTASLKPLDAPLTAVSIAAAAAAAAASSLQRPQLQLTAGAKVQLVKARGGGVGVGVAGAGAGATTSLGKMVLKFPPGTTVFNAATATAAASSMAAATAVQTTAAAAATSMAMPAAMTMTTMIRPAGSTAAQLGPQRTVKLVPMKQQQQQQQPPKMLIMPATAAASKPVNVVSRVMPLLPATIAAAVAPSAAAATQQMLHITEDTPVDILPADSGATAGTSAVIIDTTAPTAQPAAAAALKTKHKLIDVLPPPSAKRLRIGERKVMKLTAADIAKKPAAATTQQQQPGQQPVLAVTATRSAAAAAIAATATAAAITTDWEKELDEQQSVRRQSQPGSGEPVAVAVAAAVSAGGATTTTTTGKTTTATTTTTTTTPANTDELIEEDDGGAGEEDGADAIERRDSLADDEPIIIGEYMATEDDIIQYEGDDYQEELDSSAHKTSTQTAPESVKVTATTTTMSAMDRNGGAAHSATTMAAISNRTATLGLSVAAAAAASETSAAVAEAEREDGEANETIVMQMEEFDEHGRSHMRDVSLEELVDSGHILMRDS